MLGKNEQLDIFIFWCHTVMDGRDLQVCLRGPKPVILHSGRWVYKELRFPLKIGQKYKEDLSRDFKMPTNNDLG